jgi:aspartyl-tRNA(Asn)/glutamyl-tRNA(Gln) amidotransferase subunit C
MADITRDEVLRIAELAHLALSDDELERMTKELDAIVHYVKELQQVDVEGVEPTTHVLLDALPLRDDTPTPSLDQDQALAEAPLARDGSFAVAAFVDEG